MSGLLSYRSDIPRRVALNWWITRSKHGWGDITDLVWRTDRGAIGETQSSDWRLVDLQFRRGVPSVQPRAAHAFRSDTYHRSFRFGLRQRPVTRCCAKSNRYRSNRHVSWFRSKTGRANDCGSRAIASTTIGRIYVDVGLEGLVATRPRSPVCRRDSRLGNAMSSFSCPCRATGHHYHARAIHRRCFATVDRYASPHATSPWRTLAAFVPTVNAPRYFVRVFSSSIVEIFPSWDEHLTRLLVQEADSLSIYEAAIARGMASLRQQANEDARRAS